MTESYFQIKSRVEKGAAMARMNARTASRPYSNPPLDNPDPLYMPGRIIQEAHADIDAQDAADNAYRRQAEQGAGRRASSTSRLTVLGVESRDARLASLKASRRASQPSVHPGDGDWHEPILDIHAASSGPAESLGDSSWNGGRPAAEKPERAAPQANEHVKESLLAIKDALLTLNIAVDELLRELCS